MADTKVADVMTHLVVRLYPSDTVHEAARRLARNRISGAPVVENGKVVGIVSESDLIHSVMPPVPVDRGASVLDALAVIGRAKPRAHKHGKVVADVMSEFVVQVAPDTSVWNAATIMEHKGIKRLPVVDAEDYLIGIVSRADLVRAMARDDKQLSQDVADSIRVLGEETIQDLEVEVDEGIATIRGEADRKTTKELAIKLASRTPGIVEVIDRLSSERDDTKIRIATNPEPDPRRNWHSEDAVEVQR